MANGFLGAALSYGLSSFSITLIHNIFLLYYVDIFVTVYKISEAGFFWGQILFLIWNSLNDPLFGWWSDRNSLKAASHEVSTRITEATLLRRIRSLRLGGSLFALSFLSLWTQWAPVTLQFILCLFLYDGFLTYVDLNHQALMADLTVDSAERGQLNTCNSIFSVLACLSVFCSYSFWSPDDPTSFRSFALVLAALSLVGFQVSAWGLQRALKNNVLTAAPAAHSSKSGGAPKEPESLGQSLKTWLSFLKEVGAQQNFVAFSLMHLIQVFHCHFNSNFFPLLLDYLLGDTYSRSTKSILLGISFVLPHLNNIFFSSISAKYGLYYVIRALFICKLLVAVAVWFAGTGNLTLLVLFILSNRIFTEGTCKLIGLCVTDLVDEDFVLHSRKEAVSALIFGTTNLIAKPGQTLAPLLGTWVITAYGGTILFDANEPALQTALESSDAIRSVIFNLAVGVAVASAISQLLLWAKFDLHGEKLEKVKVMASKAQDRV